MRASNQHELFLEEVNLLAFSKKDRIQHGMSKRKRKKNVSTTLPTVQLNANKYTPFLFWGFPLRRAHPMRIWVLSRILYFPQSIRRHACVHIVTRAHTHTHTPTLRPAAPPHAPILLIFLHLKISSEKFINLGEFQALHLCLVPMKWDPDFANCAVMQIKHQGRPSVSADSALSFSSCLFVWVILSLLGKSYNRGWTFFFHHIYFRGIFI